MTVSDLERSLGFYRDVVGLAALVREEGRATLGVEGTELLHLVEVPGARPEVGHTGLFHFALLLPARSDLGRWLAHAGRSGVRLTGASDHRVSEALYLADPDGHGIEIYWDRPRTEWEGRVDSLMTTLPLDFEGLLAAAAAGGDGATTANEPFEGLPAGTVMGHVHLKTADLSASVDFYRDVVGLEQMATFGDSAAFLAAGGYHHHLGLNTWQSAGATPAPEGTATIRYLTLNLPTAADRDELATRLESAGHELEDTEAGPTTQDPAGIRITLAT